MSNPLPHRSLAWRSVPRSSYAIFLTGVFFAFASSAFLLNLISQRWPGLGGALLLLAGTGGVAVNYVHFSIERNRRGLAATSVVHLLLAIVFIRGFARVPAAPLDPASLRSLLGASALGAHLCTWVSFVLLIAFFSREGRRFFAVHNEMQLAADIHRSLVPPIESSVGGFSVYGRSVPSGSVGGDLVDLIARPPQWVALVGDVSGHGVPAGVAMAMLKALLRSLRHDDVNSNWTERLNELFLDLTAAHMYATLAYVAGDGSPNVRYATCGHHPALLFRARGATELLQTANPAIGMLPDMPFCEDRVTLEPGDLLACVTDGFIEVFDRHDRELGIDAIVEVIRRHRDEPLPAIWDAVREAARRHGVQTDDQTMLLIRR